MDTSSAPRVGVLIPENNTTVERELPLWLPARCTLEAVRIPRGKGLLNADTLPAYRDKALGLAKRFGRADIDVLAYGCTAAGFILGPAGDRALTEALRKASGKPIATIAHAMITALKSLRIERVGLVTPYSEAVNKQLTAFIDDAGIRVAAFDSLYASDVEALGRITAGEVADIARRTVTQQCEAVFIACAQLPTYEIVDVLSSEFHRPVLSSIQCLAREIKSLFPPERPDIPVQGGASYPPQPSREAT